MADDGCMTIAMIGTRGVPATYGGFETAVEEVGRRLVERGHAVTVYSRGDRSPREYAGMQRIVLPALRRKELETLSHSALSVGHVITRRRPDVAFVFNAANSLFLPVLRARGVPTALHVDGLEWRRAKWGRRGQQYYRWAEEYGVRWADALIADAPGISTYYAAEFGVQTELLRYGAPVLEGVPGGRLRELGVEAGGYHLVVARFEPENHVLEIVDGYRRSVAGAPLLVVGGAPYAADYTRRIHDVAQGDPRVLLPGPVYDQELLDAAYAHAVTYLHGHSVGGTNPSLLRAMGAGTAVIAHDNVFNREVLGDLGMFFSTPADVAQRVEQSEAGAAGTSQRAHLLQCLARENFTWDDVSDGYAELARRLAASGPVTRSRHARRRA